MCQVHRSRRYNSEQNNFTVALYCCTGTCIVVGCKILNKYMYKICFHFGFQKTDPGKRIWIQVVYLGGNLMKHSEEVEKWSRELGGGMVNTGYINEWVTTMGNWGWIPLRTIRKSVQKAIQSCPFEGQNVGIFIHKTLIPPYSQDANCLAFLACPAHGLNVLLLLEKSNNAISYRQRKPWL